MGKSSGLNLQGLKVQVDFNLIFGSLVYASFSAVLWFWVLSEANI